MNWLCSCILYIYSFDFLPFYPDCYYKGTIFSQNKNSVSECIFFSATKMQRRNLSIRPCSHIDRLRSVQVSSIQFETALCSDWIDLESIAIVSGNDHCSHCSSDSISNRFIFLLSSGHVSSADCCMDIIMADLGNIVLLMLVCILNAMIVDFTTRRLLQRRIYRLSIQRMPNEHVLNRS